MSAHTYHGVTITLAGGTQERGSYVTGEPYIVLTEPTNITAISSPPNQDYGECTHQGNAMVNPIPMGSQGICSNTIGGNIAEYAHIYDAAKDVKTQLPYMVAAGDSLTVSIARSDAITSPPGGPPPNKVVVYKIVVFMFVSAHPATGSFRPGFYGTNRTLAFNESEIQWAKLGNYPRAGLTKCPLQSYMESTLRFPALPFHLWGAGWDATKLNGQANTANSQNGNYADGSAIRFTLAAMWLNLDWTIAQKRKLAITLIQYGIDICSYHAAGGRMDASNTHQTGWKYPAFLAAVLLQNETMLAITRNPGFFVEGNLTTYRVSQADVGRVNEVGQAFLEADVGTYWWGTTHRFAPAKDRPPSAAIPDSYLWTYDDTIGQLLGVRMMGLETDWGWGIAFRYAEERLSRIGIGTGFFSEVYNLVNPGLPAITSVTTPLPALLRTSILEPGQSLALKPDPWGHPLRYTTNGDTPTSGSTAYTAPITGISASTTIKAKSFPADYQDPSPTATISVTVISNGTPAPPTNLRFVP